MYDVVVIGGGPGGYVAAIRAARLGLKTALVEKDTLGGVCLNRGCIPTKTLLKTANLFSQIKRASEFGIETQGAVVNFSKVVQRKDNVVKTLVNGVRSLMSANKIDVVKGAARIMSPGEVDVEGNRLETGNIIIATGSKPVIIPIPGYDRPEVITSDDVLNLKELPESIAIIGGGVIGIEFAVLFNELGCKVTVVEMMDTIIPMMDEEVSQFTYNLLRDKGIDIHVKARAREIRQGMLIFEENGQEKKVAAEKIVMAVGRKPCIEGLGVESIGINLNKGAIVTDERMCTNIKGIYAIGDVNGKYMLAHVASAEGIAAAENIAGEDNRIDYKAVPQCIYTYPEIACVGLTEKQALERGYKVKLGKFPMFANGKSLTEGDTEGFIKIVLSEKYDEILGVHMVAPHATDLIGEGVLALNLESTAFEVAHSIHPHPTVSEALMEAAHAALGSEIHIPPARR